MLPMEAHLLAAGWPRRVPRAAADSGGESDEGEGGALVREGSRACRLLFMARR